jgi:hypothetical protein
MKIDDIVESIEVNGVVLTPQMLRVIKDWQDCDNDLLHGYTEDIANVLCDLIIFTDGKPGDYIEMKNNFLALSYLRKKLQELMK